MNAAELIALGFCAAAAGVAAGLLTRPLREIVAESEDLEHVARPANEQDAGRDKKRDISDPKINPPSALAPVPSHDSSLSWSELTAKHGGGDPAYLAVWSNVLQAWVPLAGELQGGMSGFARPWQWLAAWPEESGESRAESEERERKSPR